MSADLGVAKAFKPQMQDAEVVFANEKARIAWEIGQAISRITPQLPPESQFLDAKAISFDRKNATRGRYAIFLAGTFIGTDRKGVFYVPERSLVILQKLGIPYRVH